MPSATVPALRFVHVFAYPVNQVESIISRRRLVLVVMIADIAVVVATVEPCSSMILQYSCTSNVTVQYSSKFLIGTSNTTSKLRLFLNR